MRKMCKMLTVIALAIVSTFSVLAGDTYSLSNGKVTVDVKEVYAQNDIVKACYTVTVAADAIEECETLIITPVVKNDNEKHVVEMVVLNGASRKGLDSWVAKKIEGVCDPSDVRIFNLEKGTPFTFTTCKQFFFNTRFDESKFCVTTQKATYGGRRCIAGYPGEEYVCDVVCKPYEINPVPADYAITLPDPSNAAPRIVKTQLFYPVNGIAKVASYLKNADAIAVLDALDETNYKVSSIDINGWASPESGVAYNQALSEKRAATVKKIIADKYKYDENLYHTRGNGEYWDAIIEFVNETDNAVVADSRAAIKDAIAANSNLDKREAAIKAIAGGKPYRVIFNEVYPISRFAECVVTYRAKQFDLADAKKIYAVDPKGLSADDYTAWALQEYDASVTAKGLTLYPDDENLNAVAALKAYERGDFETAIKHYKKAGSAPEVLNNLGCCYLATGDAAAAEECFAKAGKCGEANADEVLKLKHNQKYFVK